jgi:hypothetical protein
MHIYYVKAGGRGPNSAAARRPAQAPAPRLPLRSTQKLFFFRFCVGDDADGRQCHWMLPHGPTPGSRAVEPAAAADQRRGTARHGTASRSRVHRESSLSLSLHVSSCHCRARPGFSWYGDWHASAWPVPVVCTWAHINSVPNMDGDARPLPGSPVHLAVAPCMPPWKGPVVQSNTFVHLIHQFEII